MSAKKPARVDAVTHKSARAVAETNNSARKSARAVALDALVRWETSGEWDASRFSADLRAAGLDRRDAALATFLANGVVQNRILLDSHLAKLSKIPLAKLERRVLMALRLGLYQIFFSDVPPHAAVGETVALMSGKYRRSAGFVNAVLRAATRIDGDPLAVGSPNDGDIFAVGSPNDGDPLDVTATDAAAVTDAVKRLSIRYSHPEWIVRELIARRGKALAEAELIANNSAPAVTLRVNTARTTRDALLASLKAEGVAAEAGSLEYSIDMTGSGDIARLASYKHGGFWVQDVSSQLAVEALDIREGMRVLDLCSAPGGKSFIAAAKGARVVANDLSEAKMQGVRESAKRLDFDIEICHGDAREPRPEWLGAFDRVICDVPCSGLGIIRKKPDIRYKTEADVAELPALQREILAAAAKCVKKGGKILYSTCTWRKEENDFVVDDFLSKNPHFSAIDFVLANDFGVSEHGRVTLWSEKGDRDGFFVCVLGEKDV